MIDLHIHSIYSDGTCSVEEIIAQAKAQGLSQIAITDHNILEGSIKGKQISDIDFVVGTELSVDYQGNEIHLLAYFPNESDYKNTSFIIKEGETNKKIAIMEMIENLNAQGIDLDILELKKYAKGFVNRVHICRALIDKGLIKSVSEGFEKYVGDNCPAYVERKKTNIYEAIEAIHNDNGIAIIAHPYEYDKLDSIDDFLNEVLQVADGIECFHPSANLDQSQHLLQIANNKHKTITGGSDFHGSNKPTIFINMMKVDDKYQIKK